jgi:hypothetical protein
MSEKLKRLRAKPGFPRSLSEQRRLRALYPFENFECCICGKKKCGHLGNKEEEMWAGTQEVNGT